ncbi:Helix-turn-helix domain-containing protein [Pedobacter suwonensis]|uniref:Helix-turn-helix domain-containing protein n=1 Tax=Pedobacter suwonensis TaxID=332999 RepID=A0A1I0TV34_9SPHI|nr:helix-turn-helix domain-containing protein [Pedobacter suwonensis]SFA54796.1 Helix-turn-helix domain-containing protein [Pedobacter suwonensis]
MENRQNTTMICLGEEQLYELVEKLFDRLKDSQKQKKLWMTKEEAMKELNIKSPASLQKLRDENAIVVSGLSRKNLVYLRSSVEEYLRKKTRKF